MATDKQRQILQFLADQPDGSCRMNWLPVDIDFHAYRECREGQLLEETEGRGGFTVVAITDAGRAALRGVA